MGMWNRKQSAMWGRKQMRQLGMSRCQARKMYPKNKVYATMFDEAKIRKENMVAIAKWFTKKAQDDEIISQDVILVFDSANAVNNEYN